MPGTTFKEATDPLRAPFQEHPDLSKAQVLALRIAGLPLHGGAVCAGYNYANRERYYVHPPALKALAKKGLLVLSIGPDGGMIGRKPSP